MKELSILGLTQFAAIYPCFLWLIPSREIEGGYFRFNLGMAVVVLWLASLLAFGTDLGQLISPVGAIALLTVASLGLFWHQSRRALFVLTPFCLLWGYMLTETVVLSTSWGMWLALLLGGAVMAAVMLTMILGHWYLNVPGLPIRLLIKASAVALVFLAGRFIWSAIVLLTGEAVLAGRSVEAWRLLTGVEGVILWMGLLPGLLAPLVVTFLAYRTARMQSTQSATGLMYVALILTVMGGLILTHTNLVWHVPL